MVRDPFNVPAIIQRRLSEDEIRTEVRESIAKWLEGLTQVRHPECLRGIEGGKVDAEGYESMKLTEMKLCRSLAAAIRKEQDEGKGEKK
jgi:hypothetical protein